MPTTLPIDSHAFEVAKERAAELNKLFSIGSLVELNGSTTPKRTRSVFFPTVFNDNSAGVAVWTVEDASSVGVISIKKPSAQVTDEIRRGVIDVKGVLTLMLAEMQELIARCERMLR